MRYLDFSGEEGKERYSVLYDGLIGTNRGFEAPSETRVLGSILDKLEAIGHADMRGKNATFSRNEKEDIKLVIALEEAEFELAKDTLAHTKWVASSARGATKVMDWFHRAPTEKPVEEEAVANRPE